MADGQLTTNRGGRRKGLPLVPTLMTLLALPILVALGLWQLDRRDQKNALIAALEAAPSLPPVTLNAPPGGNLDFRRGSFRCVGADLPVSWQGSDSADGRPGFVARVVCPAAAGAPPVAIDLGWSQRPEGIGRVTLRGAIDGQVRDFGPAAGPRYRLVSAEPFPPLKAMRPASVDAIPNNHFSYALQWFGFAITLLVIYGVFVARWRRGG